MEAVYDSIPFMRELQRHPTCLEMRQRSSGEHILIFRDERLKGAGETPNLCQDYYMAGVHSLLYGMLQYHPEIPSYYTTDEPIDRARGALTVRFTNEEFEGDMAQILGQFLADNDVNFINSARYRSRNP